MRSLGHFFFKSSPRRGSTSATATNSTFAWLEIAVRSERAMPPAPKLACSTRSEGGAERSRDTKNGPQKAAAAPAFKNDRRENAVPFSDFLRVGRDRVG